MCFTQTAPHIAEQRVRQYVNQYYKSFDTCGTTPTPPPIIGRMTSAYKNGGEEQVWPHETTPPLPPPSPWAARELASLAT